MSRKAPVKAPNPFGEVSLDDGTQPPVVEAPATEIVASTAFVPVTGFVVEGQPRETFRDGHGFVLTERGWEKEEADG